MSDTLRAPRTLVLRFRLVTHCLRGSASRVCRLALLLATIIARPAIAIAADQALIIKGRSHFQAGHLVEAEKLLGESLAAIDAGELPRNLLGQCLSPLLEIYRTWGRNEQALAIAERYRKFVREQPVGDTKVREKTLSDTALTMSDLQLALGHYLEADQALAESLVIDEKTASQDPVRLLKVEIRSARIAEARDDAAQIAERWQKVVDTAAGAAKRIEQGQLPIKSYPDCLAALTSSLVSLQKLDDAFATQRKLQGFYAKQYDDAGVLRAGMELSRIAAARQDYATATKAIEDAIASTANIKLDADLKGDLFAQRATVALAQGHRTAANEDFGRAAKEYAAGLKAKSAPPIPLAMILLNKSQNAYQQAGQYAPAIDAGQKLLDLHKSRLGDEHPLTMATVADLGALYGTTGDYTRARPLLTQALEYWRRHQPPVPLQTARALNDLAVVERAIGSFAAAEKLFAEALALREKVLKPSDLRLAYSQSNLASALVARGEYAQAIVLYKKAIEIYQQRGRGGDDALSSVLLNVAMAYKSQGQLAKAGDYCRQAIDVYQRAFGAEAPGMVSLYNALASLDIANGQLDEASKFNAQALGIIEKRSLNREAVAATALHNQATIEFLRDQLSDAEKHWQSALEIQRATHQTAGMARTLNYLARIASLKKSPDQAAPLYREALELQKTAQSYPTVHYLTFCNLAQIEHDTGKTDEAIDLLTQAVNVIETPRAGTTGGEGERADFFAQYASAFDLLVAWNLEAGHVDAAFAYAERGRNRTFLDQLALAGVDLRETLHGANGENLRQRERSLRDSIGTLRARAALAQSGESGIPNMLERQKAQHLTKELEKLQDQYAQVWADIREASSLYRQQLSQDNNLSSLAAVQKYLEKTKSVMLFYYLGSKSSYLLVLDGGSQPQVVPLVISDSLASLCSVEAGPLTRPTAVQLVNQYLQDLRDRTGGRGLADIVKSVKGVEASSGGTALAEVLLPRDVRTRIAKQAPPNVIIVPDGALHQLPFQALLLENGKTMRYVLDVFPPIAYAPSAAILLNLETRSAPAKQVGPTLLTVGNPQYNNTAKQSQASLAAVSRDAYIDLGGVLPALPGTSQECAQIAKAFSKSPVTLLDGADATEQKVRSLIEGCKFIHLAAHGLVDQRNDNLFGAIALSPPPNASESSDNDGFLSLHEIHGLNLSGCELAVLSACQTNVGPDRPLEAGSTIAQAFLAAGAKRVVCSHWNVDDASTAEMMGAFFTTLADANQTAAPVAYATALNEAQKKIRGNSRWSAPYFWAPFVLVGPPVQSR